MGSRYYDMTLPCGCMVSLDKGGGVIPCGAGMFGSKEEDPEHGVSKEEIESHLKAWKEYEDSGKQIQDNEEIERRNKS